MRVLVTGSTGQDGLYIANKYHADGHKVLGIVSSLNSNKKFEFKTISTNLSNCKLANDILQSFKPDLIYHLAAVHFSSTQLNTSETLNYNQMYSCHVDITQNFLNWQRDNLHCKLLVALSSQMYSANKSGERVFENSIIDPQNYYASTKAMAFEKLKQYRNFYGTHSVGAILFNHTSIRSKNEFLFPQLAKKILNLIERKANEIVLRDPDTQIDITHADEICIGLIKQMNHENPEDFVFSRGSAIRIKNLIFNVLKSLNYQNDVDVVKENISEIGTPTAIGNPEKAFSLLSWKAEKSPEEILQELITKMKSY